MLWCWGSASCFIVLCLIPPLDRSALLLPTGTFWDPQKEVKAPFDPWTLFVIPGLHEVQRGLMWSDWWTLSPACWGETRRLAKARKRIPPPHEGRCYIVWNLRWCSFKFMASPQWAKQMWTCALYLYWVHSITLHLVSFVYLKKRREFHWACFSASFISMLPFFFFFLKAPSCVLFKVRTIFFLITLHAVLKCPHGKCKAVWIHDFVFVFVKGLSSSIMCTLRWKWVV